MLVEGEEPNKRARGSLSKILKTEVKKKGGER